MNTSAVVLQGVVKADGTLELRENLRLPPGPVQVTVQPLGAAPPEEVMAVLQRIWAEQKARGHVPRSREEIDAELNALRDEAEQEMRDIERIQDHGRRSPE